MALGSALSLPLLLASTVLPLPARSATAESARGASAAGPPVRVLLVESAGFRVTGDGGLRLRDTSGKELLRLPAGGAVALRQVGGRVVIEAEAAGRPDPTVRSVSVAELWIEPLAKRPESATFGLQQRRYRGRLQVRPVDGKLRAVNVVALETYLPSVVGSEMPASWPLEALRAQAVAARTYALRQRKPLAAFDLKATVSSQVYKGLESETNSTRQATISTRGLVLMHGNALIDAVFHSSSGGATENSGDLWTQQRPYLVSVEDFDDNSPVRQWRKPLPPDLLAKAFPEIGGVGRIDVIAKTASGRVRQARVIGPSGRQLVVNGAQLRSRLGLRSTWVRFEAAPFSFSGIPLAGLSPALAPVPAEARPLVDPLGALLASPPPPPPAISLVAIGRGFGHGVGMSQWGAYALAKRGQRFEEILRHYYQGAVVLPYPRGAGTPLARQPGDPAGLPGWTSDPVATLASP
ncbi:MAG: SpoIID/LytB domain-containing protein [Cyanobacteria bacterium]|nr:SpoIID/LytB domain-containing protein [Cyanobacteria bacterium bin.51]